MPKHGRMTFGIRQTTKYVQCTLVLLLLKSFLLESNVCAGRLLKSVKRLMWATRSIHGVGTGSCSSLKVRKILLVNQIKNQRRDLRTLLHFSLFHLQARATRAA